MTGAYDTTDITDDMGVSRDRDRQEAGMLVLSRKQSQQIVIGRDIRITVVRVERSQVRLGIEAPRGVVVLRQELVGTQGTSRSRPLAQGDIPRVPTI
jgi:carbon storage regulator